MAGGVLNVLERDTRLSSTGNKRDPKRVGSELAGAVELSALSETSDHSPCLRLTHTAAGFRNEQRAQRSSLEVVVKYSHHRSGKDGAITSSALAVEPQNAMASVVG
jgi:hypothetical protein